MHLAAATAGIDKRVTHARRCATAFATHLLEQKVDIRVIQVLLGPQEAGDHVACTPHVATDLLREVISPLDQTSTSLSPVPESGRRDRAVQGRPALEVADIFRAHGPAWREAQRGHLSLAQLKVMSAITQCRTAALGGHVLRCDGCGADQVSYNSCRNRHCPKCQSSAAKRWLDARQADLLPVEYYHVVFTLPAPIADIAYQNKAALYGLLFDMAAETLLTHRGRSQAPGRAHRRHAGAAHLGLGADAPPARARHRARRRAGARRQALGGLPAGVLPAGARAVTAVQATLPGGTAAAARGGKLQVLRRARGAGRRRGLQGLARAAAQERVGGLCQAAVRGTAGGAGLPVALHAPRGHLQQPAARDGRARRDLPLEGLPGQGRKGRRATRR